MALEIQVGQLANAISKHDVGILPSNMVKNSKKQILFVVLVTKEEDSDNEESIPIESDPSIKELQEEELDAKAPMENQSEPSSKKARTEDTRSTENMSKIEDTIKKSQLEHSRVDTMEAK